MRADRRAWVLLCSGLLLAGCGGGGGAALPDPDPDPEPRRTPAERLALKTFQSDCSDFLDYAADALTEQFLTPVFCTTLVGAPCPVSAAEGPPPGAPPPTPAPTPAATAGPVVSAPPPGADGESGGTPDRGSGTNTQEQGVDEADIVKADAAGNLYVLADNRLSIVDAYPPQNLEQAALATLDFTAFEGAAFYASDFFLDESAGRAVVLGSVYDAVSGRPRARAVFIDVTAPQTPAVVRRLEVDGGSLVARRIGPRVHRVSRYDVPAPSWFYDDDALSRLREHYHDAQSRGDEAAAAAIRGDVRAAVGERVQAAGAGSLLPQVRSVEGDDEQVDAVPCDAIAHPDVTTALGLMVVDSFDTDGSDHAASAVINNAYTAYASTANLYLVQSSWGWFFDRNQTEETAIYRLALAPTGAAAYRAVGKVDGSVGNSYQLSEFDGHLRVASTEWRFDEATQRGVPYNHVTVLDAEAAGTMTQTGAIRDLAPDETIRGSRFVGPRGFVVTFRQIDPLFALDLTDPAAPRVADELKIPGFSSYLMPLGNDYLLTIGRDGTDEQLTGKLAVQLFDVADLGNIRQVSVLTPDSGDAGGSYSVAEYDPHAFTYFADADDAAVPGTLSVPLQTYGENWQDTFSGFLVVRVDPAAGAPLSELGRVDHSGFVSAPDDCAPPPGGGATDPAPAGAAPCEYWYGSLADPLRSVFLEDALGRTLYTVSRAGLVASDAAQPAVTLGRRALP